MVAGRRSVAVLSALHWYLCRCLCRRLGASGVAARANLVLARSQSVVFGGHHPRRLLLDTAKPGTALRQWNPLWIQSGCFITVMPNATRTSEPFWKKFPAANWCFRRCSAGLPCAHTGVGRKWRFCGHPSSRFGVFHRSVGLGRLAAGQLVSCVTLVCWQVFLTSGSEITGKIIRRQMTARQNSKAIVNSGFLSHGNLLNSHQQTNRGIHQPIQSGAQ